MDRDLMLPDRALIEKLNQHTRYLLAMKSKNLGSGAIREAFAAGPTSVSAGGSPTTLVTLDLDPGRWVVFMSTAATTNLSSAQSASMDLTSSVFGVLDGDSAYQEDTGFLTTQLSTVAVVALTAITPCPLHFSWSGTGPSISCRSSTIAIAPV